MSLTLADLRVKGRFGEYPYWSDVSLADLVAVVVAEGGEKTWLCRMYNDIEAEECAHSEWSATQFNGKQCGWVVVFRIPEDTSGYQGANHE